MRGRKIAPTSRELPFPELVPAADGDVESSLLDVVDKVLNKGAVVHGDLVLGVANVDLIYANLALLLAALDKIERRPAKLSRRSGHRGRKPKARKKRKRQTRY